MRVRDPFKESILSANFSGQHLPAAGTIKILIADDDASMRTLLRSTIIQWGYEVIEATNGEEAWDILMQPEPPSLLILDWRMPKLDGIALCERIRKELDYYPYIIFLTQMSGTSNIIKGFEVGADEFLLKPVNLTELRIRVFAGERIIKYLDVIQNQKEELQASLAYSKTLEYLITLLAGSHS